MGAIVRTPVRSHAAVARGAAVAVAVVLGAGACGSATSGSGTAPAGTSSTASAPTSSTTSAPGGRMTEGISQPLVLVRTGGIGGVKDRLEIRPDGTYTVTSKGRTPVTRQLSEGQLAA